MSHENTIKELEQLKRELQARIREVDNTINMLKSFSNVAPIVENSISNDNAPKMSPVNDNKKKVDGYNPNSSMRSKVLFVIKHENRFLHAREIASFIHKIDPFADENIIAKKVSPAVSGLKNVGKATKVNVGTSNINTFWGIPKWLDENGNIKEGFKFDEKQITYGIDDGSEI